MRELPEHRPGDIAILDMEASIEHLTRGTLRHVDVLLVIAEPYYRSLETAGRTVPLARDLGLERIWIVGNKVQSAADEAAIREYCDRRGFEVVGMTPFDESISEADRRGRSLIDHAAEAPAVQALAALADRLVDRLEISRSADG